MAFGERVGAGIILFLIKTFLSKITFRSKKTNIEKIHNKSVYFSRISLRESAKSSMLKSVANGRDKTNSSYISAFSSHAIHRGSPVSRSGLKKTRKINKIELPKTVFDKAINGFHSQEEFRLPFVGNVSQNDENDSDLICDQIEENLFKDLTRPSIEGIKANEITLISSEIGCGKSTLLTNLLYRISSAGIAQVSHRTQGTLPNEVVKISFDDIGVPSGRPINDSVMREYAHEFVEKYLLKQIREQTNLSGGTLPSLVESKKGVNLIILFDDLDGVYQIYCRDMLTKSDTFDPRQGPEQFFPFVFELIRLFSSGDFSELGIRCVFGLRIDTLKMVRSAKGPTFADMGIIKNLRRVYELNNINGGQLLELIKKRFLLAISIEKKPEMKITIQKRLDSIKSVKTDLEMVSQVSVQGLRHTVHLIQQLEWSIRDQYTFDRFFQKNNDIFQFFLCGEHLHFSQVNQGVTNIFLVNSSYRKENNPSLIDGEHVFSDSFLKPHKHTYFLKYLILCYITVNDNADRDSVISLFSETGKYKKELVELVLFSLCEVRHGRLIRPSIDFHSNAILKVNGLTGTERGKHFVKNNIFWSFDYLSLIVEDHWLQVPKSISNTFDNPIGLKHLSAKDKQSYTRGVINFLEEKSVSVPLFINLLELAYDYEFRNNTKLICSLRDSKVKLPNFDVIRAKCMDELKDRCNSLSVNQKDYILGQFREETSEKSRAKLKKLTKLAFENCY